MVKKIESLTPAQEAQMPAWRDKWIEIGLRTGDADFETFDKYIKVAYEKAGLEFPDCIVRVKSPKIGAQVAATAHVLLANDDFWNAVDAIPEMTMNRVMAAIRDVCDDADTSEYEPELVKAIKTYRKGLKLEWHSWFGGQFWVGGWWGSPAFVSFFTDVCDLELEPDIEERATAYRKICESVNYFWCNAAFVVVCDRPQTLIRDAEGRLHNEHGKAITYKDGWGLYCLDGIALEEEMFKNIASKKMTFDEIMKIPNADIQAVALKYNPEAILNSNAELIHSGQNRISYSRPVYEHNSDCYDDGGLLKYNCCKPVRWQTTSQSRNELFLIKGTPFNRLVEEKEIYFVKMKCPTGRTFIEGVEPGFARNNPDADKCQAWLCGIKPELYRNLRIEG